MRISRLRLPSTGGGSPTGLQKRALRTQAAWDLMSAPEQAVYDDTFYSTFEAFVSALPTNLVTVDQSWQLDCYNDWPAGLDSKADLSGFTTDATHNIIITSPASERHDGTPGSGFHVRYSADFTHAIDINVGVHATAEWMDIATTGSSGCVRGRDTAKLYNSLVSMPAVHASRAAVTMDYFGFEVRNCIVYDSDKGIGGASDADVGVLIDNCTAIDCTTWGFKIQGQSGRESIVRNCVAHNCGTSFDSPTSLSASCSNNAASDASTTTPPGTSPLTDDIVNADFADYANEDYHLSATSQLKDVGVDLSSIFTDDIDGETRTTPWDIGADANFASASDVWLGDVNISDCYVGTNAVSKIYLGTTQVL